MSFFTEARERVHVHASRIKYLFIKRPDTDTENPYLNSRRSWNLHVGTVIYSRFMWQMVALLCLYLAGMQFSAYHDLAKQSKLVPYVLVPTRNGEALAVGQTRPLAADDKSYQLAELKRFIEDWRLVTPDVAVQRKAIDRVYSKLLSDGAATAKFSKWFQEHPPLARAETIVVNTQNMTAVWRSNETVQIDWEETTHDRSGAELNPPLQWRAMLTARYIAPTADTNVQEMEINPARVFVTEGSWTPVATK